MRDWLPGTGGLDLGLPLPVVPPSVIRGQRPGALPSAPVEEGTWRTVRRVVSYGVPALAVLVEIGLLSARGPVNADIAAADATPLSAAQIAVCVSTTTDLLRQDLVHIATGGSGSTVLGRSLLVSRFGGSSPLLARIELAHERLLRYAGDDLLDRYDRDVNAELRGYALRLKGACSTPGPDAA